MLSRIYVGPGYPTHMPQPLSSWESDRPSAAENPFFSVPWVPSYVEQPGGTSHP